MPSMINNQPLPEKEDGNESPTLRKMFAPLIDKEQQPDKETDEIMYTLLTRATIDMYSVPSSKLPEIARALQVLGSNGRMYAKFSGYDKSGVWHSQHSVYCDILVPLSGTKRRLYFSVIVNRQVLEIRPDNDVFDAISIVFE